MTDSTHTDSTPQTERGRREGRKGCAVLRTRGSQAASGTDKGERVARGVGHTEHARGSGGDLYTEARARVPERDGLVAGACGDVVREGLEHNRVDA
eukprot:27024-Rhodomonas_salina.1